MGYSHVQVQQRSQRNVSRHSFNANYQYIREPKKTQESFIKNTSTPLLPNHAGCTDRRGHGAAWWTAAQSETRAHRKDPSNLLKIFSPPKIFF